MNGLTPKEMVEDLLIHIGEDPSRDGLIDTPARVVKSWLQLYKGYTYSDEQIGKMLKVFDEPCDEMVVLRNIEFYSTCEHHMLPFVGEAHIGYIPRGKVVGISKLARLLEVYSRRLQIQERLGAQVAEALIRHLDPKGCGVVLKAKHFCMTARGVNKQHSVMVTSSMRGVFRQDAATRAEFIRMIER